MAGEPPAVDRRELAVAVAVLLAGAALALVVAQAPWVHVRSGTPGTVAVLVQVPLVLDVTGTDAAPAVVPLAVLALAGAVGLLATRGWARSVLAALLVLTGAAVLVSAVRVLLAPRAGTAAALAHQSIDAAAAAHATYTLAWWWPLLAAFGGVLVAGAAAFAVLRGRRWPAMGARFDAPARAAAGGGRLYGDAWSALDRGEDPTLGDEQTGAR